MTTLRSYTKIAIVSTDSVSINFVFIIVFYISNTLSRSLAFLYPYFMHNKLSHKFDEIIGKADNTSAAGRSTTAYAMR